MATVVAARDQHLRRDVQPPHCKTLHRPWRMRVQPVQREPREHLIRLPSVVNKQAISICVVDTVAG